MDIDERRIVESGAPICASQTTRQLLKDIISPLGAADNDTKPIEHDYDPPGRIERVVYECVY